MCLDVDLRVTEEDKSVCIYSRRCDVFQKLTSEMNRSGKVHSAWKQNISGLLEIHKQIMNVKNI